MSWTDNQSIKVMKYLRDKFKINTFIETGTYVGVNSQLQSKNFIQVITCEKVDEYYLKAKKRLKDCENVLPLHEDSTSFLRDCKFAWNLSEGNKPPFIYLDAHFYDPKMPKGKGKFVILDELKAMKGWSNVVIAVHDFDNNLGHINYDGIPLDLDLMRKGLNGINPNFHFYTNTLAGCDIVKNNEKSIKQAGLPYDKEVRKNLKYAWQEPRLTYRGILYALPKPLTKTELKNLGLRKWN